MVNSWWWLKRRRRSLLVTYAPRVLALTPIAYYELNGDATDSSGNGYDGSATGATFAAAGIGDGGTAGAFDGTGDVIDIHAMLADFDSDAGSILVWGKTAAWADSTIRFLVRIAADTDNLVAIGKGTTTNELRLERAAGGISETITSTALAGSTAYFSAALTWIGWARG